MPLPPNTRFGRYEILSQLGAGGMGEVYLAEDTELERQVALKVLPAKVADAEGSLRRFVQEARAASALNHPNILTVYEIGNSENSRFIVTELIKGETLRERLRGEPLSLRETLDAAVQIASALNAAHQAGVVHRDIKPENVMLRDDGLVKVLDFGLAKLAEKKTEVLDSKAPTRAQVITSPGMVMGTVAYMSPEQARGKETDARSDVWSLGVVVYEMLTRGTPFEGETANDTIAAILTREPAPLDGDTPPELQRIVRKALRKDRDERYQTVKDLLLDLKNLKHELEFAEELERSQIPDSTKASNVGARQPGENATAIIPSAVETQKSLPQATSSAEYIVGEVRKHKVGVALGSLMLLALIGVGLWFFFNRTAGNQPIESIAVMPFVNESGNADAEYLSDGMTETLINSLSQVPNLNVKARSSVFRYKGKDTHPQTIGRELSVQAILNGRVMQRGEQLRLSLELVETRTENVIWSGIYDRKQTDLVSLQSEVARDVSQKLKTKLSGADEQKLTKNYTENAEAYRLYLQGRFHRNKRTPEDLRKAIEYFNQAVAVDPNYALGYAGLAETYVLLSNYGGATPRETMPRAKDAALKALLLDDNLAETHTSLGYVLFAFDYDFAGAEVQFKRAIELNPNYAVAHSFYSNTISAQGRHEEALAEIRRALEIEPLSPVVNRVYGERLFYARRYDDAIAQMRKALELDANFVSGHYVLSTAYRIKGNHGECVEAYAKYLDLSGKPKDAALIRQSFARRGWQEFLRVLASDYRFSFGSPFYTVATHYAALDEKDKAFVELNKSYDDREYFITLLKIDPRLDPLRDDPRFQELLKRVGFPQ